MINRSFGLLLLIAFYLSALTTYAQIPVGTWRTHLSFNQTVTLTADSDNIYTALSAVISIFDKLDGTIPHVSGRLIYKTQSNGNSTTWQLLNSIGGAVNTGVYPDFVSNDDKSKQQVGKIAIVK